MKNIVFILFFFIGFYFLGQGAIIPTSKGQRLTILSSIEQAKSIPPGKTFAIICGKCKGVWMTTVKKASKEHLTWFDPGQLQNCPGLCQGIIQSRQTKDKKNHFFCNHCGEHSAFACCSS
ncbi:hypothetical protein [Methylacidiphilum caldifontis]|uniref:Uncharacterized protein n=1 Tax=Methylacidiphilum caldifontis TaxID=2795386 RepID=A0A4Y8PBY7_9BACT|nr:hypothetical protein [Methylacidiphilum caldifontis]QSR89256.1 hypothetical protein IT6_02940 [Methylacidiphilum caldifontis]TFE68495.1 hypothetical protein A7Q10_08370 [Methylacidiphilum caldifontis]